MPDQVRTVLLTVVREWTMNDEQLEKARHSLEEHLRVFYHDPTLQIDLDEI